MSTVQGISPTGVFNVSSSEAKHTETGFAFLPAADSYGGSAYVSATRCPEALSHEFPSFSGWSAGGGALPGAAFYGTRGPSGAFLTSSHISAAEIMNLSFPFTSNTMFSVSLPAYKTLEIIYTNDIHGAISPMPSKEGVRCGGMATIASAIDDLRKKAPGKTLVLDGGDWGQGTLESNISKGQVMTEIMNEIGYDAIEVGNHEFDWGPENFKEVIAHASVPVLGANIVDAEGKVFEGLKPYIIKNIDGMKVGVFGLINDDAASGTDPANIEGISFLKTEETAEKYIQELKRLGAEYIIALSHNGDKNDEKLAQAVKGIDMIVGGHSHTVIETPRTVNGTIIVQAGTQGKQVGHVKLTLRQDLVSSANVYADTYPPSYSINPAQTRGKDQEMPNVGSIKISRKAHLVCLSNEMIAINENSGIKPDETVQAIVSQALEEVKKKSDEVLCELHFDMPHDRLKVEESVLGDFLTQAIRSETQSDIAFQTSAGIRDQLLKGPVTYGDVYRVFPFDNITGLADMTGEQIRQVLERSAQQSKEYLQASGITMDINRKGPDGGKVTNIRVKGEPIELDRTYRVAVNDLLLKGAFGYQEFTKAANVKFGKLQRDYLMDYVRKNPVIAEPPPQGTLNFI